MLDLAHILVRDGVLPLASLVSGGGLGLEHAGTNIRDFADPVQICQHEGMLLALEKLLHRADLDPGALGKLGPDERFQLRPPIGSFSGLLGRELARLI